jgi:hypothetical protein
VRNHPLEEIEIQRAVVFQDSTLLSREITTICPSNEWETILNKDDRCMITRKDAVYKEFYNSIVYDG